MKTTLRHSEVAQPYWRPKNLAVRRDPSLALRMTTGVFLISLIVRPCAAEETLAKPLSLADCYQLALQHSETIAIHKEQLAETEAQFRQALGGILPHVDFVSTDKRQDSNGAGGQFTLTYIPERKFSMIQPLFSGFKEFASMSGAKAAKRQQTFERIRAEQLLFQDVSDAFYLLLEQRQDLGVVEEIRHVLERRINELTKFEELGRSRASEVTSAKTQLRQAEAEYEHLRGQEMTVRALLEFLTGHPIEEIVDPLGSALPALSPPEIYMNKANVRPDVRAAEEAQHVAEKQVTFAKGDYWPNASIQGNYYTQRAGVLQGIDWDALILLDLPIFSGGTTKGNVNQAKAKLNEARLQKQLAERQAIYEIRDAYALAQSALTQTIQLKKALDAAEENQTEQVQDYRRRLVNNIDVLQSLQTLENVRRDFTRSQYEVKRLYWKLKAATGEIL